MPKRSPNASSSPWGNWRGNARELAIVVVGVFIALVAQQLADDWQWRQKTRSAMAAMRQELLWDNGPQIYQRAVAHPCAVARLDAIRAAVETGKSRAELWDLIDSYGTGFVTYDSAAHDAAVAAEAFTHMSEAEAASFANIYPSMPVFNRTAEREAANLGELRALRRTGGPLSAAEVDATLARVEALRNDEGVMWGGAKWVIPTLRKMGPLDAKRTGQLVAFARDRYGDCIQPLPDDFPRGVQ
jgi:hypothetical protein